MLDDPATRYPSSTSRSWPPAARGACPPSRTSEFGQADAAEVAAAFAGARVELADGRALTWYGPRIPAALAGFRELLAGGP